MPAVAYSHGHRRPASPSVIRLAVSDETAVPAVGRSTGSDALAVAGTD
ncbi:hypothetical protein [Halogranum amylolyticum]|nr:hypothetical protein [Halogranum amylolyticum]